MPSNTKKDVPPRIKVAPGSQLLSTKCYRAGCGHPKGDHTDRPELFQFVVFTNCNNQGCNCGGWFDPESLGAQQQALEILVEEEVADQLAEQKADVKAKILQ